MGEKGHAKPNQHTPLGNMKRKDAPFTNKETTPTRNQSTFIPWAKRQLIPRDKANKYERYAFLPYAEEQGKKIIFHHLHYTDQKIQ